MSNAIISMAGRTLTAKESAADLQFEELLPTAVDTALHQDRKHR